LHFDDAWAVRGNHSEFLLYQVKQACRCPESMRSKTQLGCGRRASKNWEIIRGGGSVVRITTITTLFKGRTTITK